MYHIHYQSSRYFCHSFRWFCYYSVSVITTLSVDVCIDCLITVLGLCVSITFCITSLQVYEDVKSVFIVAELMRGGELLDRIIKQKNLSEREAASIMYTLSSALSYLHNEGVGKILYCYVPVKTSGAVVRRPFSLNGKEIQHMKDLYVFIEKLNDFNLKRTLIYNCILSI